MNSTWPFPLRRPYRIAGETESCDVNWTPGSIQKTALFTAQTKCQGDTGNRDMSLGRRGRGRRKSQEKLSSGAKAYQSGGAV